MRRLRLGRRGAVAGLVAALVALGAFVVVGRWEARHHAAVENARMAVIFKLATSHGILSPELDGYQLTLDFDCLGYDPRDSMPTLVLCFDGSGRLVETIDRRGAEPHFGSLQESPSQAAIRVPVPRLLRAFDSLGLLHDSRLKGAILPRNALPLGYSDSGMTIPR